MHHGTPLRERVRQAAPLQARPETLADLLRQQLMLDREIRESERSRMLLERKITQHLNTSLKS